MSPVRAFAQRPTGRLWQRALDLLTDNGDSGLSAASVGYFLHVSASQARVVLDGLVSRRLATQDGDPSGGGADLYRAVPRTAEEEES